MNRSSAVPYSFCRYLLHLRKPRYYHHDCDPDWGSRYSL